MKGAGALTAELLTGALLTLSIGGCDTRLLDAVVRADCSGQAGDAGCPPLAWPNDLSSANSDPWLVAHHAALTVMRPKVLVLDFVNDRSVEEIRKVAEAQIAVLAEGSRYHGYKDPSSPPFLSYELAGIVDLADRPPPADWSHRSSTLLPVTADGAFDATALFSRTWADRLAFTAPGAPGNNLGLCQVFERGLINEVWLAVGESGVRAPPLSLERKQIYDEGLRPLAGKFEDGGGGGGEIDVGCAVTVRLAHLSPDRGAGCDLQIRGWNLEALRKAIPYLAQNALPFLNGDFDSRFGVKFSGWPQLCDREGHACVDYPSSSVATGTNPDGTPFRLDPFTQGCGTSEFPPNARVRWDYASSLPVQSRCEHYGLRDGPGGQDATEPYTSDKVAAGNAQFPDCGGGWQLYWRQSMPGLRNPAFDAAGRPMLNWWPFLFY